MHVYTPVVLGYDPAGYFTQINCTATPDGLWCQIHYRPIHVIKPRHMARIGKKRLLHFTNAYVQVVNSVCRSVCLSVCLSISLSLALSLSLSLPLSFRTNTRARN